MLMSLVAVRGSEPLPLVDDPADVPAIQLSNGRQLVSDGGGRFDVWTQDGPETFGLSWGLARDVVAAAVQKMGGAS
jgi:hypothetical protein